MRIAAKRFHRRQVKKTTAGKHGKEAGDAADGSDVDADGDALMTEDEYTPDGE